MRAFPNSRSEYGRRFDLASATWGAKVGVKQLHVTVELAWLSRSDGNWHSNMKSLLLLTWVAWNVTAIAVVILVVDSGVVEF